MTVQQLELDLWNVISSARQTPEEANLVMMFNVLDQTLVDLDTYSQLRISGDAVCQIADLFCDRTNILFAELQAKSTDEGPIMPNDAFDRYVRQSMVIDLEQFLEPLQPLPRKVSERDKESNSLVGDVDKEVLLQALEQDLKDNVEPFKLLSLEEELEQVISTAHGESVSEWVEAIAAYLSDNETPIRLTRLQQALKLPMVEVWLGLLLGGFCLEQRGGFYDSREIWIS
ncbi:hypothetical protein [Pseudanabaena yagii]|uniref:Segregation/condensation protein A n=1 Tax=Pseudanabaena yagii GIHE-NHR1 TaxID=2722753 RepID=A0ABX1LU96_9CYAN|nr:hypothetical protein [Pseudanabaena yagii]NMF59733.1 hypothetical protein [Pseudanabaena yagii GIHE-NHR1]